MNTSFLQIKDLQVAFRLRKGVLQAVDGVNLTLDAGETLGIVGESGSGKSVTAKSIVRLNPEPPAETTGKILVEGENVFAKTAATVRLPVFLQWCRTGALVGSWKRCVHGDRPGAEAA